MVQLLPVFNLISLQARKQDRKGSNFAPSNDKGQDGWMPYLKGRLTRRMLV